MNNPYWKTINQFNETLVKQMADRKKVNVTNRDRRTKNKNRTKAPNLKREIQAVERAVKHKNKIKFYAIREKKLYGPYKSRYQAFRVALGHITPLEANFIRNME